MAIRFYDRALFLKFVGEHGLEVIESNWGAYGMSGDSPYAVAYVTDKPETIYYGGRNDER